MKTNNIEAAFSYYKAFEDKDVESISRHLDPDVHFISPAGESRGKDAVVEAAKRLVPFVNKINVRAAFEKGDQVMLAYDLMLTGPVELSRAAVLMTFKRGLIARTELFYDARPFGNL